jgi:hypothetical protein
MSMWQQIVVEGSEKLLRAFLVGFETGRGRRGGFILGSDLEMESESLGDRLLALFERGSYRLVFAQPPVADGIVAAVRERGTELDLRLESRHEVTGAGFSFRGEAFSRELAATIRDAMIVALPEGVTVDDLAEREERDPDAEGTELYAPEHSYVYRVEGRVAGPFPGVVEMHRRASDLEQVDAGRIEFQTKEL